MTLETVSKLGSVQDSTYHFSVKCKQSETSKKIKNLNGMDSNQWKPKSSDKGRKQVEEFLKVVGIIFPIKHWNCADNQNNSGFLAESSFQ